jgi:SAM-dependent methyltransferase
MLANMNPSEPLTPKPFNAGFFDAMFDGNPDPWHFKSRWYESRKRALTLACLPAQRYASAFEPGCANGELSAALATRCERLLCSDGSALAVQAARSRLIDNPNTSVRQLWLPDEWPDEAFDLIVISELAYYLDAAQIAAFTECVLRSLTPQGTVLACHWRHPIAGCSISADEVRGLLASGLALPQLATHLETDFRMEVWSRDARSVAQREGLA